MTESIILSNRYSLEERLGSGGMAMVYRAYDTMLERTVAIKLLRKDYSNNPEFCEQLYQEAKAAANLSHPNIVTIYDFSLNSDPLFIIMEYVPGSDLKSLLRKQGKFNIPVAIDLIIQACDGIGYAHRAGLVHCDIKPQNLLVTPDNRLKVVDFGIARALASILPEERAEIVWGSPQYFSPEQAQGLAPSPASDVYSLGIVLFEMLTGQLPFKGETPEQLADHHRISLPPSPRKINPNIPEMLDQIILKVLSKEPAGRYRTADQLGSVLRNFNQNQNLQYRETFQTGSNSVSGNIPINKPVSRPQTPPISSTYSEPSQHESPLITIVEEYQESTEEFDWITWGLALLALLAAGGLIPFLLWVNYMLNPPL